MNFLFIKSYIAAIYSISNTFKTYSGLQWRVLARNRQKWLICQVMYAPSGHNIGRRITNPGRFVLYSVLKIILRKNWKSVLILFFYDFFHFSKNEKVKKNAKKCIKEAEIEKKLSALFFLKFDLESTVEDQNFKKINNEASRAKTIFSRKKIVKLYGMHTDQRRGAIFLYASQKVVQLFPHTLVFSASQNSNSKYLFRLKITDLPSQLASLNYC